MLPTSPKASPATIPIDTIVDEILLRASPTTIGRCRCVCKELKKLLSTPSFVSRHYTRPLNFTNQKTLLLTGPTCSIYDIDKDTGSYGNFKSTVLPFATNTQDIMILTHVRGLLCIGNGSSGEMYLWNPTTTEHVKLPTSPSYGRYSNIDDAVGLFVNTNNTIELIHVTRRSQVLQAHIFSTHTQTWRTIPFNSKGKYLTRSFAWSSGTFSNNNVYFTVTECWLNGHNTVIQFNIETETLAELPFPPVPYTAVFQGVLLDVEGNLHMVVTAGMQTLSHTFWKYIDNAWHNLFTALPLEDISLSIWETISHYLTSGRWFILNQSTVLHTITSDSRPHKAFHGPSWFRGYTGAILHETLASPHPF